MSTNGWPLETPAAPPVRSEPLVAPKRRFAKVEAADPRAFAEPLVATLGRWPTDPMPERLGVVELFVEPKFRWVNEGVAGRELMLGRADELLCRCVNDGSAGAAERFALPNPELRCVNDGALEPRDGIERLLPDEMRLPIEGGENERLDDP